MNSHRIAAHEGLLFLQEAVVHITTAQVLRRPAMTALGVATSTMLHHPGRHRQTLSLP
jgi:hypothetical protein